MSKLYAAVSEGTKAIEMVVQKTPIISFKKFDGDVFRDRVENWEHGMFPVIGLKSENKEINSQRFNLFLLFFITSKNRFSGF